jgi:hypothetical protein
VTNRALRLAQAEWQGPDRETTSETNRVPPQGVSLLGSFPDSSEAPAPHLSDLFGPASLSLLGAQAATGRPAHQGKRGSGATSTVAVVRHQEVQSRLRKIRTRAKAQNTERCLAIHR